MKQLLLLLCLFAPATPLLAEQLNETTLTDKLNGTELTYTHSGGWKFSIKYSADGLSYTLHNDNTPWSKYYRYQAIEVSAGVYFTSWFDHERNDYVTQLINLNTKRLYGSVLLAKEKIHFEQAIINTLKQY